jgi:hypothetical protein
MSPQEMIGKIMSEPEIAIAFQNPKIQAAIMDVSSHAITSFQPAPMFRQQGESMHW